MQQNYIHYYTLNRKYAHNILVLTMAANSDNLQLKYLTFIH